MKERPIICNAESVKAILSRRKTQTRRVMKTQPDLLSGKWRFAGDTWQKYMGYPMGHDLPIGPYGTWGDRLYVRETFWDWGYYYWNDETERDEWVSSLQRVESYQPEYVADCPQEPDWIPEDDPENIWRKIPSIYMPKWASRITLEVKSVRVQRVQEISENDAVAEGFYGRDIYGDDWTLGPEDTLTPIDEFTESWDSINAKRGYSWDSNPFVWVVEFGLVECDETQPAG